MKMAIVKSIDYALPEDVARFISGATIYDSSSSPEARVYFIDKHDGYYLKLGQRGALAREAEMNAYFHKKGFGVEVLSYTPGERDIMLTRRAIGEDCTSEMYLNEPKRLCDRMAVLLRELHEVDHRDCPVQDRNAEYIRGAIENYKADRYDKSHFPDSFGYASGKEAYSVLVDGADALSGRVLLHGDYCLPNIVLDNWGRHTFIDVGNGGVGDRHIDLFWGAWTLWFNLNTDKYRDRFLDAYGRDVIDEDILRVVAAAEVFG